MAEKIETVSRREARFVAYASGNFGKNILWVTADVSLLFVLTDLLHIPPALAGSIFLAGLICDALLDLAVGAVAGGGRKRAGRYGAFILLGAPATAAAFVWLYSLPSTGPVSVTLVAVAVLLFRALYSLADVPHNSMIAWLAQDSRSRTRIAAYRYLFSTASSLLIATTVPAVLIHPDAAARLYPLSLVAAAFSVTTLWLAWITNKGRAPCNRAGAPSGGIAAIKAILKEPDARVLLIVLALTGIGPTAFSKGFIYYGPYVIGDARVVQLGLAGLGVGQFAGIPIWIWLASRSEKATALVLSHLVAATAFIAIWSVAPDRFVAAPLGFVAGLGLAGVYMLPWAMAPDVVDRIEARAGHRPEAMMFALLILTMKAATGLGAAFIGAGLQLTGYVPDTVQALETRRVIAFLTCLLPAVGSIAAALLASKYRLTHVAHAQLR